jgi:tetratricopeptide (TPR) repeat protein
MRRIFPLVIIALLLMAAVVYLVVRDAGFGATSEMQLLAADYVGEAVCAQCHEKEVQQWRGSHHDLAMQHATADTVLGDFGNKRLDYFGIQSSFFKDGEKFIVRTDGPDGKLRDYEVKYTFGIKPLQQYLVELDKGRLQALQLAWDTRPAALGGQRWFHLYPDQKIDHTDELHWTELAQNWNHMCAECHSTNLKKGFDVATDAFHTTWSEINVSCEACHGAGSNHVAWANKQSGWKNLKDAGLEVLFDERHGVVWRYEGGQPIATRSKKRETAKEIETCARCHSRRSQLSEDYHAGKPLMDTHLPALLTEQLYFADGQVKEEVYVYGSFLQSKMYHKGVTCSDCHDPHSLQLRAPDNQVCLQCHQASHYNTEKHHFHPAGSDGARCAACHMPARTFMVIDERYDHSFRVPRPDLSSRIGSPNTCVQCHSDKSDQWANDQLKRWYGSNWPPGWHYGEALFAGRTGEPGARRELAALATTGKYPAIVRATAVSMLAQAGNSASAELTKPLLGDSSPQVREAALALVDAIASEQRWPLAGSLLDDPVYAVRIEAARVLAVLDRQSLTPPQLASLDRGVAEYVAAQQTNAEQPHSHVNLGLLYTRLRKYDQAESAYRQALQLDPAYVPGYINLADLYRSQGKEQQALDTLLQAQKVDAQNAAVAHALGLHDVRAGKLDRALQLLKRATRLAPRDVRYAYVYAVALHDSGRGKEALAELDRAYRLHPNDLDVLIALVSYNSSAGKIDQARRYAQTIAEIEPRLGNADQILGRIANPR